MDISLKDSFPEPVLQHNCSTSLSLSLCVILSEYIHIPMFADTLMTIFLHEQGPIIAFEKVFLKGMLKIAQWPESSHHI